MSDTGCSCAELSQYAARGGENKRYVCSRCSPRRMKEEDVEIGISRTAQEPVISSEAKYLKDAHVTAIGVFEDLNRPTDEELAALQKVVGMREQDFYYESSEAGVRALRWLVRAATTARQVKREANPPSPGMVWDTLARRWVEANAKGGPAITPNPVGA